MKMSGKSSRVGKQFKNIFKSLDMYSMQVGFNIEGKNTFKTCTGGCFVLFILVLTLVYGQIKFMDMMDYAETNHQTKQGTLTDEDIPRVPAKELGLDWAFSL